MGVICLVLGLVVNFFGRRFFPYVIAIIGGGMAFLCTMLLCSVVGMMQSMEGNGRGHIGLTILAFIISGAVGVAIGWLLKSMIKIGACVLGGVAGFFLGFTLYNFALAWTENIYILIALSFGLAIALAYTAFKHFNAIVIFGTSLIGSYSFIRGISIFAGHYPNEVMIFNQLSNGVKPELDGYFYLYFSGIVVMFVLGVVYQHKTKNDNHGNFTKVE